MAAVSLENWEERIRDPKVECMSSDEMAALQSKRLVDVVKRVYDHVDFYHKKMKETGVEPGDIRSIEDINKLPFTTKEDLRANYPFGLLAIPQSDVVRVQGTSGTTGKLTIAPYSQKDVEVWGECVARCLTMAGLTKDDILHVCYGYGLFTGGLGLDFGARALGAMTIPMSAGNTKRQMMVMEDLGATAFACTPSYALYLAESIQEAGLTDRLKIRAGIHGAEPWTEEMRKKIENILHINCFDIYGLCEITGPGVAMDCIHHAGLHVNADHFYPEVLNPANKKLQASVLRSVFRQPVSASLHSGIKFLPVSLLAVSFLPRFSESVLFRPVESLQHFPSIRHQGTIPDTRHVPSLR